MDDTISRADVLSVRLKNINFKIFFDLTGEGDQDCGGEEITCSLISIGYQYLLPRLMWHEDHWWHTPWHGRLHCTHYMDG